MAKKVKQILALLLLLIYIAVAIRIYSKTHEGKLLLYGDETQGK